jgi:hypothetical protein
MIIRSLSRRLERLETSLMPTSTTSNPLVIELQFVSPEKVVTSSMSIRSRSPCDSIPEKAGWAMKAIDRPFRCYCPADVVVLTNLSTFPLS